MFINVLVMRNSKKGNNVAMIRILIRLVVFFLFLASLVFGVTYWLNKPRFVRYPAFGIEIPVNYPIHGIDISHHQSAIDWKEVRAMKVDNIGINFCFIKATEGIESVDEKYRKNWYEAESNGIIKGAYHYFNPTKSGIAQARNYIQMVKLKKGDLPPVLDVEQINGVNPDILQQRVSEWLQTVEACYNIKPIIYTNVNFYENYLADKFDNYPLWVAHYLVKDRPRIGRNWIFWQHNECGRVNGVDANVDFNVFNVDFAEFEKILLR